MLGWDVSPPFCSPRMCRANRNMMARGPVTRHTVVGGAYPMKSGDQD